MYIKEKIANKRKIRRLQQRSNIPRTFVLTHIYHFEFTTLNWLGPSKSISGTHMHESSTHRILQFSSLTIYAVTVVSCRSIIAGMTLLLQKFYELIAWLFPCEQRIFLWYSTASLAVSHRAPCYRLLTNDRGTCKSSHFIPFTWSRDICITLHWCHLSNKLWHVVYYHVEC